MAEPGGPPDDSGRRELVRAAQEAMREDAALLERVRLDYLEPLITPQAADRWIARGGVDE